MPFGLVVQPRTPILQAGKLRHKIDIVKQARAQDSTGGLDVGNTVPFAAGVWASIEAISGTETQAAGKQTSVVTHQIVIRYVDGVTAAMQVLYGTRRFLIESVLNPDERTKMLILKCVEISDSRR